MKKQISLLLVAVLLAGVIFSTANDVEAKSKVEKVVETARKNYYGTNEKIKDGSIKCYGSTDTYKGYSDKNGKIRKIIVYASDDGSVNGCTSEFYFNKKEKLVFAFAYKKVKGKTKEYRAYYSSSNGKLYRYIKPSGKIKDYKKGTENMPEMAGALLSRAQIELHYAYS